MYGYNREEMQEMRRVNEWGGEGRFFGEVDVRNVSGFVYGLVVV